MTTRLAEAMIVDLECLRPSIPQIRSPSITPFAIGLASYRRVFCCLKLLGFSTAKPLLAFYHLFLQVCMLPRYKHQKRYHCYCRQVQHDKQRKLKVRLDKEAWQHFNAVQQISKRYDKRCQEQCIVDLVRLFKSKQTNRIC